MTSLPRLHGGALAIALSTLSLSLALFGDTELNIPGYRLVWHDEFEATAVDPAKWDVNVGVNAWYQRASDGRFVEPHWFNEEFDPWIQAGTINDERQYYSPDNVTVSDGVLEIRADHETVENTVGLYDPAYHQYTSGKLNTADEFQFRFGIVKWRARLPSGQGLWPALWMLNAPDPWYWDDEIDVMEARGSAPTVTTSAHHFKVGPNNNNQYNFAQLNTGVNLQEGFHEYGLEWTADSIQTWWNDQLVFTDSVAIPQGPMFLIMNAAVGGFFDGVPGDNSIFPTYFRIDWVRVWQPATNPGDLASGGFEEYQGAQWANWNTLDNGNLESVTAGALHGSASVRINPRKLILTNPDLADDPGMEASDLPPPLPTNRTGFVQTVTASPGQPIRYGLMVANHATDPIRSGASGRLRLEFLDAGEAVLEEVITTLVDADSPAQPVPYSLDALTPSDAAFIRLSIERITTSIETEISGSFLADTVFLQVPGTSELPLFESEPPSQVVVKEGQSVDLDITISSPDTVTYQWYHLGEKVSTAEDYSFVAQTDSAGRCFAVATNAAGPVVGAITEIIVLDAGPDSDGDLLSDSDETDVYGTNPLLADSDGDGHDDYDELFIARTDPLDASSRFRITGFHMDTGQVEITFTSVPGLQYALWVSQDLVQWSPTGSVFTATEPSTTVIQTVPVSNPPTGFFKVSVNP